MPWASCTEELYVLEVPIVEVCSSWDLLIQNNSRELWPLAFTQPRRKLTIKLILTDRKWHVEQCSQCAAVIWGFTSTHEHAHMSIHLMLHMEVFFGEDPKEWDKNYMSIWPTDGIFDLESFFSSQPSRGHQTQTSYDVPWFYCGSGETCISPTKCCK